MSEAPMRIWASPEHPDENGYGGFWIASKVAPAVEYVRADEIERLQAELREARDIMRRARLSLSAAARDFHAQQADDLLLHALAKSEAQP